MLPTAATSPQPVLDDQAKREFRQRVSHLAAEIDDLRARGETGRAATSIAERDWLTSELATGAGGRSRRFTGNEDGPGSRSGRQSGVPSTGSPKPTLRSAPPAGHHPYQLPLLLPARVSARRVPPRSGAELAVQSGPG
jgi:hypothetical protein